MCAIAIGLGLGACKQDANPIAQLTEARGPVDRREGAGDWGPVKVGTRYFLNDAARTHDGKATLEIGGSGGAQIVMTSDTVLRFGGQPGQIRIAVEGGTIDLSTGSYALDIGDVKLQPNGTVQITSRGNGRSSIELKVGQGKAAGAGESIDLVIGKPLDLAELRVPADAGVRDAPVAAPDAPDAPDAALEAAADASGDAGLAAVGDATIEITGKRAELLAAGDTVWRPLPAGAGGLARGSAVRLGPGTIAKAIAGGTTVELASGARLRLGDDAFALEAGVARAAATSPAAVALPGGAVALGAAATETRLEIGGRDTRVTMLRGGAKLTGNAGAELAMSRGETALLTRTGVIRQVDAIPGYFDFRVAAGESMTIHDPRPPVSVQLQFDGKCPDGGIIEIDRDFRFRTARVSGGRDFANVLVGPGGWAYRLRCTSDGVDGAAVASGRVTVVRDDGRRPLPKSPGINDIDADGRTYRISYQSAIPSIVVHVRNPGAMHKLHLAAAGKEQTFDASSPAITVPGAQLREGTYTYWLDRDGVKQDKVSTLIIDFDQTAPQVYIESPVNAQPWTGDIDVRGAVLPGWIAAAEAIAIPIDRQRRFAAKVGAPSGNALAIRLSHPQHGVHYYLRRQK